MLPDRVAERARFELAVPFRVRPLSRRVPSTTRPPLRCSRKALASEVWRRALRTSHCSRIIPSLPGRRRASVPAEFLPSSGSACPPGFPNSTPSNRPHPACIHSHFMAAVDLRISASGARRPEPRRRHPCRYGANAPASRNVNFTPAGMRRGSRGLGARFL